MYCIFCFSTEVCERLIQVLMNLVFQLLCDGELMLARTLRKKVLEKCNYLQMILEYGSVAPNPWPQYQVSTRQYKLLEFRAEDIARQMTMMDQQLFQKIEVGGRESESER